jgi:two-component system, NarL family, nitrate/nitrite response regulator NarL
MSKFRVLVIGADPLARAGLATLLAGAPEVEIVGQTGDVGLEDALATYRPDVIVWDTGWQPAEALERLEKLAEQDMPVLVLLGDEGNASEAWTAGGRGLLSRTASPEQIAAGIAALYSGLVVVAPDFAPILRTSAPPRNAAPPDSVHTLSEPLTPRELEVLRLVADGLPNKTIAGRLGISEHTVKFHVNALLGKLGAASRTEAVVTATRLGLILL